MERKTGNQLVCGKRKCRNALQDQLALGRYHGPSSPKLRQKVPDSIGSARPLKTGLGSVWGVVAAGAPITANQYHCATVGGEETSAEADRVNAAHWRTAPPRGGSQ
jgi:hypothetical protein